jgi:hypothetical protein
MTFLTVSKANDEIKTMTSSVENRIESLTQMMNDLKQTVTLLASVVTTGFNTTKSNNDDVRQTLTALGQKVDTVQKCLMLTQNSIFSASMDSLKKK